MDPRTAARYQNEMNDEYKSLQEATKKLQNLGSQRVKLLSQVQENEMVKKELDLIEEDEGNVYKLIGPMLVKQDLKESKMNVDSRLKRFKQELYNNTTQYCHDTPYANKLTQ